MKRILLIIICLAMLTSASCTDKQYHSNEKINIVCSVFPIYDFTREIAGDRANITMLLPPGSEAHTYEPTPKDILSLKNADVFIGIGGESEHWALHLLEGEELQRTPTLFLIDSVTPHVEEFTDGMDDSIHSHNHEHSEDCGHHDTDEEFDEHIWTSPANAAIMCREICDKLADIDSKNTDFYEANTQKYIKKLQSLLNEYHKAANTSKRKTIIFGDRFPLRYLTEELSLEYYAAFPGCSSKTEPSVKTVLFLTDKIKNENIPVIFYMDYSDGRIAKTIARECNIKALRLYSCHNLSKSDFSCGKSYISLMKENLVSLKEALN